MRTIRLPGRNAPGGRDFICRPSGRRLRLFRIGQPPHSDSHPCRTTLQRAEPAEHDKICSPEGRGLSVALAGLALAEMAFEFSLFRGGVQGHDCGQRDCSRDKAAAVWRQPRSLSRRKGWAQNPCQAVERPSRTGATGFRRACAAAPSGRPPCPRGPRMPFPRIDGLCRLAEGFLKPG